MTYILGIGYLDADEKYAECDNYINSERSRYNGIWLCNNKFHLILKIVDGKIYQTYDDKNRVEKEWEEVYPYSYDENTGILSFQYSDHKYNLTVSGDTLTLTFTNKKDAYDYDWFDSGHTFTKIPF